MGMLKIFGDYNEKEINRIIPIVEKIEELEYSMGLLTDRELKKKTSEFKKRINNGETLDSIMVEAFAVCREAAYRVLKMKHYRVQILGGIILHQGRIAEMKTGEGKTLVGTLPVYLNALTGEGVHVITSNEYLAERDMMEMGEVYKFLGLTVDVILNRKSPEERREAYNCDITYGVNSEIGFDYLRDNMAKHKNERVQRGLNYTVVDEIDSILIDDARTPLIISGGATQSSEYYFVIDKFVKNLEKKIHYEIDEKRKVVTITDEAIRLIEEAFNIDNYASMEHIKVQHHVTQALKANYTMKKDVDYIIKDGEILIVDISTGRVMEGRRFSDGLHQAIEVKENVKVNEESKTLASITLQNLFRMYKKLSGMSGTVASEEMEFREIYSLDVIKIPTNKPIQRIDKNHVVYKTVKEKYMAIVEEIIESNKKGQPILVGTSSIEKSEDISALLKRRGVSHKVLNAKNHGEEAKIVSKAGQEGAITIATNMAGRGTDIKLSTLARKAGGLKVIGTELHDSVRVDNQLRGRSGRQGDVGESIFFVSLEDYIIKNYISDKYKKVLEKTVVEEGTAIKESLSIAPVNMAQKSVEEDSYSSRKQVVNYDDVLDKQRSLIYEQRNEILDADDICRYMGQMLSNFIDDIIDGSYLTTLDEEEVQEILGIFERLNIDLEFKKLKSKEKEENKNIIISEILLIYQNVISEDKERIEVEKSTLLNFVDENWIEYMCEVDYLKLGIGLRAYKQMDPILEFKIEASEMFNLMTQNIQRQVIRAFLKEVIEFKNKIVVI